MKWPDPLGNPSLRVPAAAALLVLVVAAWPGAFGHLAWDRDAIAAGEWWRVVTGQFAHLGPGHAALNLAGLAAAALLLHGEFGPRAWAGALLASMAGVAAGLQWASPGVGWYAGLSGALHGVFAAAALDGIGRRRRAGWLLAGILAAKIAWELAAGASGLSVRLTGGPVLVVAHAWGALGGAAFGLARLARRRRAVRGRPL